MKKVLLFILCMLLMLGGLAAYQYILFHDGKLHVVFCDVGQGDAILIKTPNDKHILIDGGPDQSVLNCLSRHMPFWQRKIDLMLLTHPHADHFFGMFYVLERYTVGNFATEELNNKTQSFQELLHMLSEKKIPQKRIIAGDVWRIGKVKVSIVGPTTDYLNQTSPGGTIGESKEFASVVTHLSYGTFDALFTGDSQAQGLKNAFENVNGTIEVLQSPHHGSATGLDREILQAIAPKIVVISVGAKNHYGHPSKETLELLQSHNVKVLRTDRVGDVELVSGGKHWN